MPITPSQCRAARALIDMGPAALAKAAEVARETITAFEKQRGTPPAHELAAIRAVLELSGVQFIPENGGGAGVRLKFNGREVRAIDKLENEGGIVADDDI